MKPISIVLFCALLFVQLPHAKPIHDVTLKDSKVDVPWTEFRNIIEKLTKKVPKPIIDTAYPPVDFLIPSARISGKVVDRKTARLVAEVKIVVLKSRALKQNGWVAVPVGADRSAMKTHAVLERAELNGKPVPVHSHDDQNHVLISSAGTHVLKMHYYCPVASEEGNWKIRLNLPRAASASLDLLIPDSRAEVWVNGIKRATESSEKGTQLRTALSLEQELNLRYSLIGDGLAESGDSIGMTPKVFASTGMLVTIKENRISYQYRVDYQIWHQKRTRFAIALPDSLPIENVHGAGLSEWKIEQTDKGARLVAKTSFAPDRSYSLTLNFSKKLETAEAAITVPVLRVLDVNRESGYLAVQASETMEVFTDDSVKNLTAVAAGELPDWLQSQKEVLMRFKYTRPPYALSLKVLRHKDMPVLVAIADEALFTGLMTRDGYTLVKFRYFIRNNHKQYLSLTMPEGWTLWSALIDGNAVMPASSDLANIALIPLKKMSRTDEGTGFILELVYWNEGKKMGLGSKMKFETPIIDINCQQVNGELWMPERYQYKKFKGSLEKVEQYTARYIASAARDIVERKSRVKRSAKYDYNIAQSNTMVIAKQGKRGKAMSLPVEIEVPTKGSIIKFSKKLTIAGEKGELSFKFSKRSFLIERIMTWFLWFLTLLIAFYACRWILANRKVQRIWPVTLTVIVLLCILYISNIAFDIQAPALFRTTLLGVLCALLSHIGSKRREEVVA